ncbi:MAG: hypothetical protein ACTS6P_00940 [Candidatus Hodgkinia cicadicola]
MLITPLITSARDVFRYFINVEWTESRLSIGTRALGECIHPALRPANPYNLENVRRVITFPTNFPAMMYLSSIVKFY